MSTKAQQTYERVNTLVEGGTPKAEAFKQLASEYGQPVTSVRGAYYSAKRVLEGGDPSPRRSRKRETTPDDAVAAAVATLEAAVDAIEQELLAAGQRATEAQAEYEAMQATAAARTEEIRAKIAVLAPAVDPVTPTGTPATRKEGRRS